MNLLRTFAGVSLTAICAVPGSGWGADDVPSDAVARVGDTVTTKQQFDHWYASAAKSQAQQGGPAVPPDPPNYTKCVAALKQAQPKPAKGTPAPKDSDLKKQCKQSYDQLKQQVMQFLIQSQWVQQEAEERDVKVSGKEIPVGTVTVARAEAKEGLARAREIAGLIAEMSGTKVHTARPKSGVAKARAAS